MVTKKSSDGVKWKRGQGRFLTYYWQIGNQKSKDFNNQRECAMDYIKHYIDKNPKYLPLVEEKSWEQLFSMFGVNVR